MLIDEAEEDGSLKSELLESVRIGIGGDVGTNEGVESEISFEVLRLVTILGSHPVLVEVVIRFEVWVPSAYPFRVDFEDVEPNWKRGDFLLVCDCFRSD